MATAPLGAESALANPLNIFATFDRKTLANAVEVLVCVLDALDGDPDEETEDRAGESIPVIDDPDLPPEEDDGDPDIEANGDELDGNGAEDDFMRHGGSGPGCPVADPDVAIDDSDTGCGVGDYSYAEWHTLPSNTRRTGGIDGKPKIDWRTVHEDAEDDDPAEDGGDETDGNGAEDEACAWFEAYDRGPGCEVADPGIADTGGFYD